MEVEHKSLIPIALEFIEENKLEKAMQWYGF